MRNFDIDNGGSDLVNEHRFKSKWNTLKVMIFKGKQDEFNYPFKTTKDFLGVLCSSQDINSPQIVFDMHQESKQREKNSEHLLNLNKNGLINEDFLQASGQSNEVLPVAVTQSESFLLLSDMARQKIQCKDET